jgi:hypothetical protein
VFINVHTGIDISWLSVSLQALSSIEGVTIKETTLLDHKPF